METIKVFLGMEVGRYDGYEFGTVLATLPNGCKVVSFDYSDTIREDSRNWYQIGTAFPDMRFGWYIEDTVNLFIESNGNIHTK